MIELLAFFPALVVTELIEQLLRVTVKKLDLSSIQQQIKLTIPEMRRLAHLKKTGAPPSNRICVPRPDREQHKSAAVASHHRGGSQSTARLRSYSDTVTISWQHKSAAIAYVVTVATEEGVTSSRQSTARLAADKYSKSVL